MKSNIYQLQYEPNSKRLMFDGWKIHCGNVLKVLLPNNCGTGTWHEVSFEVNEQGWYMPGHPGISPVGLFAKEE